MARAQSWWVGALALILTGACSAIINPDENRFGEGEDAGAMDGSVGDAGAPRDAGDRPDAADTDAGDGCPPSCDDSVACTQDRCEAGRCVNEPDDDECDSDERCNPVMGCVPERCENNGQCDDGMFCNGVERCVDGAPGTGCVSGDMVVCNDGASCTDDACDEDADMCAFTRVDMRCADAVACTLDICNPEATMEPSGCVNPPDNGLCTADFCTVDQVCDQVMGCMGGRPRNCADMDPCTTETCNEATDMCDTARLDADMDMFPAATVIGPGGTMVMCGGSDCDDGDGMVNPGAMEVCGDGIDNNCAMGVDEGCLPNTCGAVQAITLSPSGRASVNGMFSSLTNNYQTSAVCGAGTDGRDAVYYIDLPAGRWDVTIDTNGSVSDTVLGVGFTCSTTGFAAACNDDQNIGVVQNSRIWLHQIGNPAAPLRVYILVDGFDASATGAYTLNIQRQVAVADSCLSAGSPMNITGGGTVLGQLIRNNSFYQGSCGGSGRTEAIFQLTGGGTDRFEVYSADFNPTVYLRRDNCRTGMQVGCVTGSSIGGGVNRATLSASISGGGTNHYLFVDNAQLGNAYAIYYEP